MKSVTRIISRYLLSAVGVALILLVVNFVVLFAYLLQTANIDQSDYSISQVAEGLTLQNGKYQLSDTSEMIIEGNFQWAMLLDDEGEGHLEPGPTGRNSAKIHGPRGSQFFPLVSGGLSGSSLAAYQTGCLYWQNKSIASGNIILNIQWRSSIISLSGFRSSF